jgi:hypothetical protein
MTTPAPFDSDEIAGDLADDLRGRVKSELDPDERLLWVGRATHAKSPSLGCVIAGAAVVVGAGLVAVVGLLPSLSAWINDGSPQTFGVVAALIGFLTLLATLFAWSNRLRVLAQNAVTLYALTDRRAIIWMPAWSRKGAMVVQSVVRGGIAGVDRIEYADGSGDVRFRLKGIEIVDGIPVNPAVFRGIADVRRVEELARRTLFVTQAGDVSS